MHIAGLPGVKPTGRRRSLTTRRALLRIIEHKSLHFGWTRVDCGVEEFADVQCPYCGQTCEIVIDTSVAKQRFNTDCEVCCRPFEVVAECKPGEIVSVEVSAD